jgi:hypothetical protein
MAQYFPAFTVGSQQVRHSSEKVRRRGRSRDSTGQYRQSKI